MVLNVTPGRMRNACSCSTAASPPRNARLSGSGAMGGVLLARHATGWVRCQAVGLTCPAELAALAGIKVPAMIMQQKAVRASGDVFGPIDRAVAAARKSARRVM